MVSTHVMDMSHSRVTDMRTAFTYVDVDRGPEGIVQKASTDPKNDKPSVKVADLALFSLQQALTTLFSQLITIGTNGHPYGYLHFYYPFERMLI